MRAYWRPALRYGYGLLASTLTVLGIFRLAPHINFGVSVAMAAVSLALLFSSIVAKVKPLRRFLPERTAPKEWRYDPQYDGWRQLGVGPTRAIYSPVLNQRLAADHPITVSVTGRWRPRGLAAGAQYELLPKQEGKYCLDTDLLDDTTTVALQKTDYAAFRVTNRLAYELWWDKRGIGDLTVEDVEPRVRDGVLPPLAKSNFSNHIGGDILAIGDGVLFLQLQDPSNGMYPGMWVGSASGSFNRHDLTGSRLLQDLVRKGLLRELREEMHLRRRDTPKREATKVIGYSRATYLGGKPQFYGVCRIGAVTPRPKERFVRRFERVEFNGGAAGVTKALDDFAAARPGQLAPPLEMLIQVVKDWLLTDPGAAAWLWPHAAVPAPGTPGPATSD